MPWGAPLEQLERTFLLPTPQDPESDQPAHPHPGKVSHPLGTFRIMDCGSLTEDQLDRIIAQSEQEIASWRVVEMAAIREKKSRQSHHADGYRSIVDWVASRADISHQTSRNLCWTASRLEEAPEVAAQLESGDITFDRAEQLARLPEDKEKTTSPTTLPSFVDWWPITAG